MKHQILLLASTLVMSANALAFDLSSFVNETHEYEANYDYADGSLLFYPNDFKGFELGGSHVFRPNLAVTGVFSRLSADVANIDITATQIGVGGRYFFALESLERTDLDLSASLVNSRVKGGGFSDSDSGVILGAQVRHILGQPVGTTDLTFEEAYAGVQLGLFSDSSSAIHAGLLVAINPQFSARAQVLVDDGTHLSIGLRVRLGRPQRNPDQPTASKAYAPQVVQQPVVVPVVTAPVIAKPDIAATKADPHGLTEEEMADLKTVTD